MGSDDRKPKRQQPPSPDEAGIHKDREAVSEDVAHTPTRGEPLSEADRERDDAPLPASAPTPAPE